MSKRLSVIIPTCNRVTLLLQCLESLMPQIDARVEVVVVNNGDKDDLELTDVILDSIKIVRTRPRIGASKARNIGAEHAVGDYLAFLDDDDFWSLTYIRDVIDYLDRTEVDLLLTNKVVFLDGDYHYKVNGEFDAVVKFNDVFLKKYSIGGQAMVASRLSFLEIGGFNPDFKSSNDKALVMDYLVNGYRVRAYSKPEAYFRQHVTDVRLTDRPFKGGLMFFKKYYEFMSYSVRLRLLLKLGIYLVGQTRNQLFVREK